MTSGADGQRREHPGRAHRPAHPVHRRPRRGRRSRPPARPAAPVPAPAPVRSLLPRPSTTATLSLNESHGSLTVAVANAEVNRRRPRAAGLRRTAGRKRDEAPLGAARRARATQAPAGATDGGEDPLVPPLPVAPLDAPQADDAGERARRRRPSTRASAVHLVVSQSVRAGRAIGHGALAGARRPAGRASVKGRTRSWRAEARIRSMKRLRRVD